MKRRTPSGEDIALWEKVTETVTPLARPPRRQRPKPPTEAAKPEKPKPAKPPALPAKPAAKPAPRPAAPPALNPLDRRTLSRIGRGTVAIDARIDLHGMTQEAAQHRLIAFLERAQANGKKVVLVITGKGKAADGDGESRGVLRRVVPHWLSAPRLRPLVVGFDAAGPTHGGTGALYVRIRRAGRG